MTNFGQAYLGDWNTFYRVGYTTILSGWCPVIFRVNVRSFWIRRNTYMNTKKSLSFQQQGFIKMANSLQLSCAQLSELFLMGKIVNNNIKFKRWIRIENDTNKQKPNPKSSYLKGCARTKAVVNENCWSRIKTEKKFSRRGEWWHLYQHKPPHSPKPSGDTYVLLK